MQKRRQHHVWKYYLGAWATDAQIFCLQDGRIFQTNVANVGVQRDFYKLHGLTQAEIDFIRGVAIAGSPPAAKPVHEELLFLLATYGRLHQSGFGKSDAALRSVIDEAVVNAVENFHSGIESQAQPLLDAARRGDVSFYIDDDQCILFAYFLSLQYFRTFGLRARVIERLKANVGVDVTKCWTILSQVYATNVGATLFFERKRRPVVLLKNETGVPFITGDQPAINLAADRQEQSPPDYLSIYYPIAPRRALALYEPDCEQAYGAGPLSERHVRELNEAIAAASYKQVFADSVEALTSVSEGIRTSDDGGEK